MRGPATFAVALGLCLLALILTSLAEHGPAVLGSSRVLPNAFVQDVAAGDRYCLADQGVPAGARTLQLVIGTYGRPQARLAVVGRRADSVVVRGGATTGTGLIRVPIRVTGPAGDGVTLCVVNRGSGRVALAGSSGIVSVIYPAAGGRSWLDEAGTIARRFDHVRIAPAGRATMWLALALALAALAAAGAVAIRGARDG